MICWWGNWCLFGNDCRHQKLTSWARELASSTVSLPYLFELGNALINFINLISEIVKIAGISLNMALEGAVNEPLAQNKIFSPQNWIKTKTCLAGINFAIRNYFNMLPMMPGGSEMNKRFKDVLTLPPDKFEYRWEAD